MQYARRADKSGMRAVEKDTIGMNHNAIEKKWNKWIIMYQVKSGERRRRKKSQTKKTYKKRGEERKNGYKKVIKGS